MNRRRNATVAGLAFAAAVALAGPSAAPAQQNVVLPGAKSTPPPPGPERAVRYPLPVQTVLPNGLRVVAVRIPGSALVAASLTVPGGAAADPAGVPGVASLTAGLLARGTQHRSAREIGLVQDRLGANLDGRASSDRSEISTDAVAGRFPAALALLAEVVREPAFAPDEIVLAKQRAGAAVAQQAGSPSGLAALVAQRALFDGAFGRPVSGTAKTIAAIDRAAIVAYHRAYYRPAGALLTIGGDLSAEDAFALARTAFGDWAAGGGAAPALPAAAFARPRLIVVDQPAAGRTAIVVARPAPLRTAPDYAVATMANAVLAGYSGRLNSEVRIKRGLSYGASSSFTAGRFAGSTAASTLVEHAKAPEALGVVLAALGSLDGTSAPAAAELAARRTSLLGGIASSVETTGGLVRTVAANAFNGLPLDELDRFTAALGGVDPAAVARFARGSLATPPTIVLVGDAAKFRPALVASYPDAVFVPAAGLDLAAASLGG
ncbi:MAG: zinc protease [Candidatus Eremiobacteraeota bacterium]|nr:zinc protease [Candidatus Eremiobacteraeota bacterium]